MVFGLTGTGVRLAAEKVFAFSGMRILARACEEHGGNNGAAGAAVIAPGDVVVRVDPRYYRPTEVASLLGDASKARDRLGWTPRIGFEELVSEMVCEDLDQALRMGVLRKEGFVVREPCE